MRDNPRLDQLGDYPFQRLRALLDGVPAPGGFFLWLDVGDGKEGARNAWRHGATRVMPGRYMRREDPATGVNPGARYIGVAPVHDTAMAEAGLTRLAAALVG